jgi:hypothetical protein
MVNTNNFDLLDPNIIADTEASMQVTTWYVLGVTGYCVSLINYDV